VRVVLDTGVVVSALLFPRGRVAWLRDRWIRGAAQPLVSRVTVEELIRVLAYPKFDLSRDEIDTVLAAYVPFTESVVLVSGGDERTLPECDDPADRELLRLALGGDAEALVTGDDDLLRLRDQTPFPILTPAQLKTRLP
jgi:putative PIN family toxin of toxin-antitoxin system